MKLSKLKLMLLALITLPLFAVSAFNTDEVYAVSANDEEVATTYKTKCAPCHSPKAEKFFDLTKNDDYHIEVILKGKKGEKPPFMPGYEAKGITQEQAKALAEYMRQLRTTGN